MNQLELSNKHLTRIGFKEKHYPADEENSERNTFEIENINGCFYYNPEEKTYRWYHKTQVGDFSNHINLNIETLSELFITLSCFRVKYNFAINDDKGCPIVGRKVKTEEACPRCASTIVDGRCSDVGSNNCQYQA